MIHSFSKIKAFLEFDFQGLYLGSVAAACNKNVLKSYNVTHILTVASSLRPAHPDDFVYKVVRGINILKVLPFYTFCAFL